MRLCARFAVRPVIIIDARARCHDDACEAYVPDGSCATEPPIIERLSSRDERIHISIGAVCNNNCIFCMEEDRDGRYANNSAMTIDRVRWILEQSRGATEVCFTSGEPTTRSELPDLVRIATSFGYSKISIMTNGRRLSHLPYAAQLAKAGINRFYISIHGHTKKLHEGLTRTPDSFEQTVAGLKSVAQLKRFGIELHTSTVLTDRNVHHLLDIYRFLRSLGVDQVVFNVMQANGRANTYFDQIFPRYTEIAAAFRRFVADVGEERPSAFLVDIPLCTTEGIPDRSRGYVERYRHFELGFGAKDARGDPKPQMFNQGFGANGAAGDPKPQMFTQGTQTPLAASQRPDRAQTGKGRGLVLVTRQDLDDAERDKRDACSSCKYNGQCEGVWRNYLKRYGWDEFTPIAQSSDAPT